MLRIFPLLLLVLMALPAGATPPGARPATVTGTGTGTGTMGASARPAAPVVRFAIINTASLRVREGMVFAGGDFGREVTNNFSAIAVQHGKELFLFDSGLGAQVASQYRQDMPAWQRPFFRYDDPVVPAAVQLAGSGLPPVSRIILSHSHWDHASGLADFPGAEVWVSPEEREVLGHPGPGVGGAWPSQVATAGIKWRSLKFADVQHEGFARSLDLFGDGSVVLVPMFGHTSGSVGMFVTTSTQRRFFFVGDAVWSAAALAEGAGKFWPARVLVDHDADATAAVIGQIRRVRKAHPELLVVPAHDGRVQDRLGYFPKWVR